MEKEPADATKSVSAVDELINSRQTAGRTAVVGYAALLGMQTVLAGLLFWIMIPIFLEMIGHLGQTLDLEPRTLLAVIGVAAVLQCCYWIRFSWVPVFAPFRSVLAEHLLMFASRVSFIFGGALFSAVFFRHVPALTAFPPFAEFLTKVVCLFGCLFALFCYSLELERLARAMAAPIRHH